MLNVTETHSLSDFLQNYEAHVARLKETRVPEVLTVNGRAEVVLLDAETYEDIQKRLQHMESVAYVRSVVREARPQEEVTEAEIECSQVILRELMEETERPGLYREDLPPPASSRVATFICE